jgi:HEAT repeat protein
MRVVEMGASSSNALERAYAFEAMQSSPELLLEHGPRGIVDENRGVRFVATMAIGRAVVGRLAPLLHPGLLDDSESVRAATIFALRSLGEGVDPSPLAAMVASDDPEIRGNATMILGMLGNPSAVPLIESSLGKGMRLRNPMRVRITELQAAEALVSLGREDDIEPIRAALFAPVEQGELTVLACDMLGRLEDEQARPMLMRLLLAEGNQRRPPEIRVAAAGAIFRLPAPWEPGLDRVLLEQVDAEDPRLRVQVAAALRRVPGEPAGKALDRMLADADPLVRIAAAGALLGRQVEFQPTTAAVSD